MGIETAIAMFTPSNELMVAITAGVIATVLGGLMLKFIENKYWRTALVPPAVLLPVLATPWPFDDVYIVARVGVVLVSGATLWVIQRR